MGTFLAIVGSLWLFSGALSSFYFWVKKTNRSQAPIVRRSIALGYGLAWPVLLFRYLTTREQAGIEERERQAAQRRIVDGTGSPGAAQPAPRIQNPFEN